MSDIYGVAALIWDNVVDSSFIKGVLTTVLLLALFISFMPSNVLIANEVGKFQLKGSESIECEKNGGVQGLICAKDSQRQIVNPDYTITQNKINEEPGVTSLKISHNENKVTENKLYPDAKLSLDGVQVSVEHIDTSTSYRTATSIKIRSVGKPMIVMNSIYIPLILVIVIILGAGIVKQYGKYSGEINESEQV